MRAFIAFLKKELLESVRCGKLIILGAVFVAFGIMNPAVAKLTPWMMEMFSEELASNGMIVTEVSVDAITSWTQFFKNIPIALITFVLVCAGSFAKEYEKGTLVLVLTKGLARYKVVIAKTLMSVLLWSSGYWLCFAITYAYNSYYWDNNIAQNLLAAVASWWLFGLLTVALMVLFSVISNTYSGVLLGTGAFVLASYVVGLFPKLSDYVPTSLMNGTALILGAENSDTYLVAAIVSILLTVLCIGAGILLFNKKQI